MGGLLLDPERDGVLGWIHAPVWANSIAAVSARLWRVAGGILLCSPLKFVVAEIKISPIQQTQEFKLTASSFNAERIDTATKARPERCCALVLSHMIVTGYM